MTTIDLSSPAPQARTTRIFLVRGLVAIAWAIAFLAAVRPRPEVVTAVVGVLLVIYPLIDVAGTAADARSQHGADRRILLLNMVASAVVAVALGVAAGAGDAAGVLVVFGSWALLTGIAQQILVVRRRDVLGFQWPLQLAGLGSALFGGYLVVLAATAEPRLGLIAIYAGGGGLEFVVQAWLLARRRRPTNTIKPLAP